MQSRHSSTFPLRTPCELVIPQPAPCYSTPRQPKASRERLTGLSKASVWESTTRRHSVLPIKEPKAWIHILGPELERSVVPGRESVCTVLMYTQLSAQLKTRLSYAMVKVQNGWEKQSLEELEEVHSQRSSPNSAPGRGDRMAFGSPYSVNRRRRPSGVSDNSEPMIMSPASDPTRSHAATPSG